MNDSSVEAATATAAAGMGAGMMALWLVVTLLMIISLWKIFTKAGQPGWASIIPIYNAVVMCQIAGKPGWWVLLLLIPVVNIVIGIMVLAALAKNFGRGAGTVIGMILLPVVFYPILAFGDAKYQGSAA